MSVKDSSKNLIFQKRNGEGYCSCPSIPGVPFSFICIISFMCLAGKFVVKCISAQMYFYSVFST